MAVIFPGKYISAAAHSIKAGRDIFLGNLAHVAAQSSSNRIVASISTGQGNAGKGNGLVVTHVLVSVDAAAISCDAHRIATDSIVKGIGSS